MNNHIQNQIEDYVTGVMSEKEKLSFDEKIKADEALRKQVIKTQRLREILLRSRVRRQVSEVRKEINNTSRRGIIYIFGTFAAAASIVFFLLSTPVLLSSQAFNYRGEVEPTNQDTESRANNFQKAQELIQKGNKSQEAIAILEPLSINPEISQNYQRASKWMLVIAYLQANEEKKAEKTFEEIKCEGIECPYSSWEKIKVQWQFFWGKI